MYQMAARLVDPLSVRIQNSLPSDLPISKRLDWIHRNNLIECVTPPISCREMLRLRFRPCMEGPYCANCVTAVVAIVCFAVPLLSVPSLFLKRRADSLPTLTVHFSPPPAEAMSVLAHAQLAEPSPASVVNTPPQAVHSITRPAHGTKNKAADASLFTPPDVCDFTNLPRTSNRTQNTFPLSKPTATSPDPPARPVAAVTRLALPGGDPWAPRLVLVTCSNGYYADRRKQIVAAAKCPACQGIFSRIIEHNETTITTLPGYDDIVKPMTDTYFRGWGYWAWKPLVVLDALKGLADDEALVYLDSGQSLHCNNVNNEYALSLARISPSTGRDVTATLVGFKPTSKFLELLWTKADTLAHFGVLDNATVFKSQQFEANRFFLRKTPASIALIQRWLDTFRTPQLVNDDPSTVPSKYKATEHRHDQSVFSILRKIHEGTVVIADIPWTTVAKQRHPAAHSEAQRQYKANRGKHLSLKG